MKVLFEGLDKERLAVLLFLTKDLGEKRTVLGDGEAVETCECGRPYVVTKYCSVCDNDD